MPDHRKEVLPKRLRTALPGNQKREMSMALKRLRRRAQDSFVYPLIQISSLIPFISAPLVLSLRRNCIISLPLFHISTLAACLLHRQACWMSALPTALKQANMVPSPEWLLQIFRKLKDLLIRSLESRGARAHRPL